MSRCVWILVLLMVTACGESDVPYEISEDSADRPGAGNAKKLRCDRNRNNGYCDSSCPDDGLDCEVGELGPEPMGTTTKLPVVLVHGFNASPGSLMAFNPELEGILEQDGHEIHLAALPPYAAVRTRALALATQVDTILANSQASRVHLIGHSMGGLDARYLVSTLGYGDRVASVTTISCPHGGSPMADIFLDNVSSDLLDFITPVVAWLFDTNADNPALIAALEDLSVANSNAFNEANLDDSRVFYQSWAGLSRASGILTADIEASYSNACQGRLLSFPGTFDSMSGWLIGMVSAFNDIDDGMVEVERAQHGVFRGCLPADHLDLLGFNAPEFFIASTGFDYRRFYRNLVFELAAEHE